LGGRAASVVVATQIRLRREDARKVVLRGQYVAVTELEALDISVLGRDIMGLFAVIVDQPRPPAGRTTVAQSGLPVPAHGGGNY
jgi:hypothetical protein